MSFVIIFMIISLVLTVLISVVAIITSTSGGTDWLLNMWHTQQKRMASKEAIPKNTDSSNPKPSTYNRQS